MLWLPPIRFHLALAKWSIKIHLLGVALYLLSATCFAQDTARNVVEVYLQQGRKVLLEHATRVLVFNEDICATRIDSNGVEFFGLKRGESVVFVWSDNDVRTTYLVRVVLPPQVAVAPKLMSDRDAGLGSGYIASSVQSITGTGAPSGIAAFHRVDWEQGKEDGHLSIRAQGQDSTLGAAPLFNLNTATIQYSTPGTVFTLLDSVFNVNGGPASQIVPSTQIGALTFRGADLLLRRGKNNLEFFGGASLPSYFLNSSGTKDIAGVNTTHWFSKNVTVFTTSAFTNIPSLSGTGQSLRRSDFLETGGVAVRITPQLGLQADGGISTSGTHGQAGIAYSRFGRSAYISASTSSADFPLNQLQLLPMGTLSINSGFTQALGSRISLSAAYQHVKAQPNILFNTKSTYDYINPSLSILLTPTERVTLNYGITHIDSNQPGSRRNNQRREAALSSQFTPWLNNSAQVSFGSLGDPLLLNAQSQMSLRDSLNFRVKGQTYNLNVSHDRVDPSLVNALNQQIQLLPDPLKQLFLFDPIGFIASGNLSPQLRALLQGIQPSNTQVSLSAQFQLGKRISFSPMVGYYHQDQGLARRSNSQLFGYGFNWQLTDTLSLQSTLSNVFLWDTTLGQLRRNTVLSVGFNKSFSGVPTLNFSRSSEKPIIRGIVFRDANVNGSFNPGELGIASVQVRLEDGRTALTDENGRFAFSGLTRRPYKISVELAQFRNPVRLTTPAIVSATPGDGTELNFGIVDFSRVMGIVFNDYLSTLQKQPDANGIKDVELTLKGDGTAWKVKTDSGGEFEIDNVPAGIYELSINRATIPADHVIPTNSYKVEVGPTQTVVADIPLRALRSVSGRVFFKPKPSAEPVANSRAKNASRTTSPEDVEPIPLKDVTLAIGTITAKTDADGNFILRELPGGPLQLTLVPQVAVADSVKLPSWPITLPHEPFKAEGVNITISNPELLQYLVSRDSLQSLNLPKAHPIQSSAKASPKPTKPAKKPETKVEQPIHAAINAPPMPIRKSDSGSTDQPVKSQNVLEPGPSPTRGEHIVIPTVNRDHLIDCVQTVARNRNGHHVLVCSDVISTR
jgi:SdrD B-like domain/Pilus formation protein N terminal region